jgi:hypothetical protein
MLFSILPPVSFSELRFFHSNRNWSSPALHTLSAQVRNTGVLKCSSKLSWLLPQKDSSFVHACVSSGGVQPVKSVRLKAICSQISLVDCLFAKGQPSKLGRGMQPTVKQIWLTISSPRVISNH